MAAYQATRAFMTANTATTARTTAMPTRRVRPASEIAANWTASARGAPRRARAPLGFPSIARRIRLDRLAQMILDLPSDAARERRVEAQCAGKLFEIGGD